MAFYYDRKCKHCNNENKHCFQKKKKKGGGEGRQKRRNLLFPETKHFSVFPSAASESDSCLTLLGFQAITVVYFTALFCSISVQKHHSFLACQHRSRLLNFRARTDLWQGAYKQMEEEDSLALSQICPLFTRPCSTSSHRGSPPSKEAQQTRCSSGTAPHGAQPGSSPHKRLTNPPHPPPRSPPPSAPGPQPRPWQRGGSANASPLPGKPRQAERPEAGRYPPPSYPPSRLTPWGDGRARAGTARAPPSRAECAPLAAGQPRRETGKEGSESPVNGRRWEKPLCEGREGANHGGAGGGNPPWRGGWGETEAARGNTQKKGSGKGLASRRARSPLSSCI